MSCALKILKSTESVRSARVWTASTPGACTLLKNSSTEMNKQHKWKHTLISPHYRWFYKSRFFLYKKSVFYVNFTVYSSKFCTDLLRPPSEHWSRGCSKLWGKNWMLFIFLTLIVFFKPVAGTFPVHFPVPLFFVEFIPRLHLQRYVDHYNATRVTTSALRSRQRDGHPSW